MLNRFSLRPMPRRSALQLAAALLGAAGGRAGVGKAKRRKASGRPAAMARWKKTQRS